MTAPTVTFDWKMTFRGLREEDALLPTFLLREFELAATQFAKEFAQGRGLEPLRGSIRVKYSAGKKKRAA